VAIAIVAAGLGSGVTWTLRNSPLPPALTMRFPLLLPEGLHFDVGTRHLVAISPDGSRIVYAVNARLYLRSMGELDARPIAGTENLGAVTEPVFSPNGLAIAFWAASDRTIKRIDATGGAAVTLCPANMPFGMNWGADGVVFGQGGDGILRVSPNGGQPEVLVKVRDGELAHGPQVLRNGEVVLFTLATGEGQWDSAQIVVQSIRSGERRIVRTGGTDARYLPTGHLVYAVGGTLFAVRFDLARLAVVGDHAPVVQGIRRGTGEPGTAQFSVSETGSLIYLGGPLLATAIQRVLAEVDRSGHVVRLKLPEGLYLAPRYAPAGSLVAFQLDEGKLSTIGIYDLSGRTAMQRLTLGGANRFPIWSSDGQRVAFQSDREGDLGIFSQRADGTGAVERLTKPESGTSHRPDAWAPEGQTLLFEAVKDGHFSLWTLSLRDQKIERFGTVESALAISATFSRSGRWVAYNGGQLGGARVYVEPFPPTGARYAAASAAFAPFWASNDNALFYGSLNNIFYKVTFSTQPRVEFGNPETVARGGLTLVSFSSPRNWDLSPDGTRILGTVEAGGAEEQSARASTIQVVTNWFQELKARVPTK
jgi:Tol biopolymer transport system component